MSSDVTSCIQMATRTDLQSLSHFQRILRVLRIIFVLSTLLRCAQSNDVFNEELLIKPLPSGHVYAHFQFTTRLETPSGSAPNHYRLFPKSLGNVLHKFNVWELHLSLTQGQWKHRNWGYPVEDAPPGGQVWAWFKENTTDVDSTWLALNGALSGLFCASFNFVDASNTIQPEVSFRPLGVTMNGKHNSSYVRYSALPNEIVCTENLTPWKKILPCDVKAGLATLLNAPKIFNTHYHSLGVHVRRVCDLKDGLQCGSMYLELTQSLSLVFELPRYTGDKIDWSFKKLFGYALFSSCPVASKSAVYVDISDDQAEFELNPAPHETVIGYSGQSLAVYDLKKLFGPEVPYINIAATYKRPMVYGNISPPTIFANRFVTGYGRDNGGISCQLHNTHPKKPIMITYLENIPWFAHVYFHTLQVTANNEDVVPSLLHIVPGNGKKWPAHLEMIVTVPPNSTLEISMRFQRAFLKWTEHPPDANHGFHIGSAIISAMLDSSDNYTSSTHISSSLLQSVYNSSRKNYFTRIYTETLLVSLPTPDFSMPYNVICLVCTVVALAFGPLHNITTRSLVAVNPDKEGSSPLASIVLWLKRGLKKLFKQKEEDVKSKDD